LLAALWHRRDAVLARFPTLPLPTYRPAQTRPVYVALDRLPTGAAPPASGGDAAGPGPDVHAAAMITVWREWPYASGPCHGCGQPMLATYWGGIVGVGDVGGTCVACFARGARFLPGIPTALFQVRRILDRTPWLLPWTPLAFRLGGRATTLRDALASLGERGLDDDLLTPWEDDA
jgi:hypothetical protein